MHLYDTLSKPRTGDHLRAVTAHISLSLSLEPLDTPALLERGIRSMQRRESIESQTGTSIPERARTVNDP